MTSKHFEQERALQRQMEQELETALPAVDVLDVELDAPREVVRMFIDSPSGVDLDLCARVTHVVRDTCPDFSLEVSSPGPQRPLRRREHFEAAANAGERVRIRRSGGGKRAFVATVLGADEHGVRVQRDDGSEEQYAYDEIVRCHLVPGEVSGDGTDSPSTTVRGSR